MSSGDMEAPLVALVEDQSYEVEGPAAVAFRGLREARQRIAAYVDFHVLGGFDVYAKAGYPANAPEFEAATASAHAKRDVAGPATIAAEGLSNVATMVGSVLRRLIGADPNVGYASTAGIVAQANREIELPHHTV